MGSSRTEVYIRLLILGMFVTLVPLTVSIANLQEEEPVPAPEAQETEPAQPEPAEQAPAAGIPVKGAPDPSVKAHFAKAIPLPVNEVTDIDFKEGGVYWFKVSVDAVGPVVLRVGGINTWNSAIKVYDEAGAEFTPGEARDERPSAWHGKVARGTYFIRLGAPDDEEAKEPKLAAEEVAVRKQTKKPSQLELATRPAMLVMVDPVGPGETPRRAAQLGLNYLQVDTPAWQNKAACNGCHMQSQALMGMALAKKNRYRVQERPALALGEFMATQSYATDGGLFAALAHRYYISGFAPSRKELLQGTVQTMLEEPPEDFVFDSGDRPPIEAGTVTGSSMAVQVFAEALRSAGPDSRTKIKAAQDGALAHLRTAPAETVQDRVMKIVAFVEAGVKGEVLSNEVSALVKLQNTDGGFGEAKGGGDSNAYGTGQALYALRIAGTSVDSPAFSRAVKWLVQHQSWSGTWPLVATNCTSDIAHTMWAVIGLAGGLEATLPIRVTAVVRDEKGGYITDLKAADFAILEDGTPQTILEFRRQTGDLSIVLVIDTSGSIRAALPSIVQAATHFLNRLGDGDRISLEEFSNRPQSPSAFTTDRASVAARLKALKAAGGTALYDSIGVALEHLRNMPEPRGIVLLTDGKDEDASGKRAGSRSTLSAMLAKLQESGIPLYALGLGGGVEKDVLTRLAGASGGRAFFAPAAQDLDAIYRELAAALRAQYLLTYNSSRPTADGKWRAITVRTARPNAKVEATPGYMASRDLLQ